MPGLRTTKPKEIMLNNFRCPIRDIVITYCTRADSYVPLYEATTSFSLFFWQT